MMRRVLCVVALAFTIGVPSSAQQLASDQDRRAALEFYRRGAELMTAEQFEKAAEEFTKAIEKDPLMTLAHYQLGQSYMNLQRYASAIKSYQDCIRASETLFQLGASNRFEVEKRRDQEIQEMRDSIVAYQRAGHPLLATKAEQHLRDLENERSHLNQTFRPQPEVLLALGSAHFRNGDRDSALAEWRGAVEGNPKLGEAHNNLAVIYMLTGQKNEAENSVKLAEKAGFRVNPQLKADIKKLRD